MSTAPSAASLEDRLRAVEDTLAIYHLIASHPPAADTGTDSYYRDAFTADGTIDLGGGKGASGNDAIAAIVKTPEHQAAIAGGLCHFTGLPRERLHAGITQRPRCARLSDEFYWHTRNLWNPVPVDRMPFTRTGWGATWETNKGRL